MTLRSFSHYSTIVKSLLYVFFPLLALATSKANVSIQATTLGSCADSCTRLMSEIKREEEIWSLCCCSFHPRHIYCFLILGIQFQISCQGLAWPTGLNRSYFCGRSLAWQAQSQGLAWPGQRPRPGKPRPDQAGLLCTSIPKVSTVSLYLNNPPQVMRHHIPKAITIYACGTVVFSFLNYPTLSLGPL